MNLLVLSVPIWVLGSSLHLFLADSRPEPAISSMSGHVLSNAEEPTSQFSSEKEPVSPVHSFRIMPHGVTLIAATAVLCVVLFLSGFWIYRHKSLKKNTNGKNQQSLETLLGPVVGSFNSLKMAGKRGFVSAIEYQFLVAATSNFDEDYLLGEGSFGSVYKARFNENFHAVVKRLNSGGQDAEREFENEVDCLSKIKHQNIISLLGYCIHNETRFLAYEMMENGSLETQLHGPAHGSTLSWHLRMKIAVDVARGLEYLHEHCNPPVIHRDLKSSNILLDSRFNAKLSDFGLAVSNEIQNKSIKLSGTLGYVAPEYLLNGKLTDKSDVYAFGVVLLELLMGRKPVENTAPDQYLSIIAWAMPKITDRLKLPSILDPVIKNTMDLKHLYQVASVAVLCVQPEPSYRPLIADVLHSLMPLVPVELGGSLRVTAPASTVHPEPSTH